VGSVDDRAVVAALVAGDPRGLESAYRAYADRLYTYCRGMLRDSDQAADAVHDTFVLAGQRAGQLRDPERLRPWLYAIARSECLRVLRGRARQVPLEEPDRMSAAPADPGTRLRAAEIQELVWAAAEGLNPGDRDVFELTVRHDLTAGEVGAMLGVSVDHAHARLSRVRAQLERALGALLVARTGRRDCPELAALLGGWDGRLTALVRKRVSRHVESCDTCRERRRAAFNPAALFSAYAGVPFLVAPAALWPRLERTSFEPGYELAREAIASRAGRFDQDTGFPKQPAAHRPRALVAVAAAVAVLALLGVGAAVVLPAEPAAEQAGPAPAVPALGSPSAPPLAVPSPGAAPSDTPSPVVEPEPPAPPPPPPPPPPSPAATPTASPTLGPLTVEAGAVPRCASDRSYRLAVSATASRPLASAVLHLSVDDRTDDYPLDLTGSHASVVTRATTDTLVSWWLDVVAVDGESVTTEPVEIIRPCRQAGP
jgi:RNA polymerase sigma factor (sigma-70 family)